MLDWGKEAQVSNQKFQAEQSDETVALMSILA